MDYLYSLYDVLVSINVPNDKARAVVDAMERDMGTTLATKQDLLLLRQEVVGTRTELRQEMENRYALLSHEIGGLRSDVAKDLELVRKDLEALRLSMTVRLGSMLMVGLGLLFAALKLT